MKTGLVWEDDRLAYYKDGSRFHAGVIQVGDDIYYINSEGYAVKGRYIVCGEMANGILIAGKYRFGKDYKLINNPLAAPGRGSGFYYFLMSGFLPVALKLLACAVILLGILFFVKRYERNYYKNLTQSIQSSETVEREPILPEFEEEVLLCSGFGQQLYKHDVTVADIVDYGNPYRSFVFDYQLWNNAGVLLISENSTMDEAREFDLEVGTTNIVVDNLKTGTEYYYRVIIGEDHYDGTFKTAQTTRFVSIPGALNTRDIGGYTTLDGKTVKQGVLIRGTEIDGLVESSYCMPEQYAKSVQDTFGFVYDFDLRVSNIYEGEYVSPLGEDVVHKFYTSPQYEQIFDIDLQYSLTNIMKDLADPQKYPMYLHCTYGADRTGTIVFLLQGILNMSEKDMIREYRMTGFALDDFAASDQMDIIVDGLQKYKGDTLQKKIVSFLTGEIGMTKEEIETIRSIFLED